MRIVKGWLSSCIIVVILGVFFFLKPAYGEPEFKVIREGETYKAKTYAIRFTEENPQLFGLINGEQKLILNRWYFEIFRGSGSSPVWDWVFRQGKPVSHNERTEDGVTIVEQQYELKERETGDSSILKIAYHLYDNHLVVDYTIDFDGKGEGLHNHRIDWFYAQKPVDITVKEADACTIHKMQFKDTNLAIVYEKKDSWGWYGDAGEFYVTVTPWKKGDKIKVQFKVALYIFQEMWPPLKF